MNVFAEIPVDHRETSEHYCRVVAQSGSRRIILCKDCFQWVVQRRASGAGGRWTSESYSATKNGLMLTQHRLDQTLRALIGMLPSTAREVHV